MDEYLSLSARRALQRAFKWAATLGAAQVEAAHLLLAIAAEEESHGGRMLARRGLRLATLRATLGIGEERAAADIGRGEPPSISESVRRVLGKVRGRSVERGPDNPAGTDLVLLELLAAEPELSQLLHSQGADTEGLFADLEMDATAEHVPLIPEFERLEFVDTPPLEGVVLYVLVSSADCPRGLEWTVREAIAGGAQVIQLREKHLPDRDLLGLARRVRGWTRDAGVLFILNDRPDIARLADADGVHVGQEELTVQDARCIMGRGSLVGVSTHSIQQARQAVLDGADYIGVGPTFASRTKSFVGFPGVDLVRQVHAEIRLPAFVIGGVDLNRLDELIAAGARGVAVSAALCSSDQPRAVAAEFRRRLDLLNRL